MKFSNFATFRTFLSPPSSIAVPLLLRRVRSTFLYHLLWFHLLMFCLIFFSKMFQLETARFPKQILKKRFIRFTIEWIFASQSNWKSRSTAPKLFFETVFYLKQRTTDTVKIKSPSSVIIEENNGKIHINMDLEYTTEKEHTHSLTHQLQGSAVCVRNYRCRGQPLTLYHIHFLSITQKNITKRTPLTSFERTAKKNKSIEHFKW